MAEAFLRPDRMVSLLLWRLIKRNTHKVSSPAIPVLMYHSISDASEVSKPAYFRISTSVNRFQEQIQWLFERGYQTINIDNIPSILSGRSEFPEKTIILTFDDGYEDFFTNAWPILGKFGYSATVYLPTSFIGHKRKAFNGRPCLVWNEILELYNHNISFGSHTSSHPKLYALDCQGIRDELKYSRATIENFLQQPVNSFSYPFAFPQEDKHFVKQIKVLLGETGYRTAVTTIIGRIFNGDDSFCIKRLPINQNDDKDLFFAKLEGGYDWMTNLQFGIRTIKSTLIYLKQLL
jgi:peptidoglycan/xylan/chitin deacetylase (PgdA/CDA1 family)